MSGVSCSRHQAELYEDIHDGQPMGRWLCPEPGCTSILATETIAPSSGCSPCAGTGVPDPPKGAPVADTPVLTEQVTDANGTWTQEWYCPPPPDRNAYHVTRCSWTPDGTTRKIYEISLCNHG